MFVFSSSSSFSFVFSAFTCFPCIFFISLYFHVYHVFLCLSCISLFILYFFVYHVFLCLSDISQSNSRYQNPVGWYHKRYHTFHAIDIILYSKYAYYGTTNKNLKKCTTSTTNYHKFSYL